MLKSDPNLNVYAGKNALMEFLSPEEAPCVPLVEVPAELNPFCKDGVRIFAKLMYLLPLMNVKSLPAFNMLTQAKAKGKLKGVESLIESSSGSMALSLSVVARAMGISTQAILSHWDSVERVNLMRFFGIDVMLNVEPAEAGNEDPRTGMAQARSMGKAQAMFNPDQYANESNPSAHERWTGPQIWKQTRGKITVLCAGLGTTGTLLGSTRYFRSQGGRVTTVGVVRSPEKLVPGVRTAARLKQSSFDFPSYVDYQRTVEARAAYETSLNFCRHGILMGPSSGLAFAGMMDFLKEAKTRGTLENLRNADGEVVVVGVCTDSFHLYLREYFEILPEQAFPPMPTLEPKEKLA